MAKTSIDFVMGKGGVGRTTVSMLLAEHYAAQGQSSIIVECNGCTDIPEHYGKENLGYTSLRLTEHISTISISPMAAIEEYVIQQLKLRKLYTMIFENRLVTPLIEAAPGLHDAVQLGKIYDLQIAAKWDHVIVDCPATGHGLSLISGAKTMMALSRRGPLYNQNQLVEAVVRTHGRVIFVTLPEELPCRETLQLWEQIRPDFREKVLGVIINQWQSMSPVLSNLSSTSSLRNEIQTYPNYAAALEIIETQHQQQQLWIDWLTTHLLTPQDLASLHYPVQSPFQHPLSEFTEIEAWL